MSRPTPQQQQAIEATGAVLLSAGAGTGKTATLVQRCLRAVLEGGVDVDRLLVVTFTNAAAAEMRQRLREALRERALNDGADRRLQRQLLLLDSAHLCTIHSFCLELLRAHFAELGLDPGVAVLDDSVTVPLARNTALELLQEAIEDADTRRLAEDYAGGRGERLAELVLRTHRHFMAQPRARTRLAREAAAWSATEPTAWRTDRDGIMREWLADLRPRVRSALNLAIARLEGHTFYGGKSKTAAAMQALVGELERFRDHLEALPASPTAAAVRGFLQATLVLSASANWVRNTGSARSLLEELFEEALVVGSWQPTVEGADPLVADWERVRRPMSALLELVRRFDDRFTAAKRALGGVDFADLEQLALELLTDENGAPTAVARLWQRRLDQVLVDECQDINAAQEALVRAVARTEEASNLFMVGDVKQSIYRFRQAAPELFREHATEWRHLPHHQVLLLTENFRSREGILVFANALFGFLMEPRLEEVGYGPEEQLAFALPEVRQALSVTGSADQPGEGEASAPDSRVELHLVELQKTTGSAGGGEGEAGGNGWDEMLDLERQAHVAASRLRALADGGHRVWDKRANVFRAMRWSDVGILLRSVTGRAGAYVREFRRQGIPLAAEQGDFLATAEAIDLASLLRVLDNPGQDVPLGAVLRSPLVGWTLEDLVAVRTEGKGADVWERLQSLRRGDSPLAPRTREFIGRVERWRRLALMTSLTAVLETVLSETRYEAYLLTLPDGADRVAQVRRFLDLARRYDPLQRQGLPRFLAFLDEQAAAGREIEPLPPREVEAVQLLSIHKSKGLEFPVVVISGLGSCFQQPELRESLLLSRRWGLAPQVVEPERRCRYDTMLLWQAKREESIAAIAEELRLLYVAVTRARDTLLLVGSFRPEGKSWRERLELPPSLGIRQARSYFEWVAMWLHRQVPHLDWSSGAGEVAFTGGARSARLCWSTYAAAAAPVPEPSHETPPLPGMPTVVTDLSWLEWRYDYEAATQTPAKTSASALRKLERKVEEDAETAEAWPVRRVFRPVSESANPGRLSATDIGTAHHVFLQHLRWSATDSLEGLRGELDRLQRVGILGTAEARAVDLEGIQAFWDSPVGREVRDQESAVRRELAFTAAFQPAELPALQVHGGASAAVESADFVVVQGAVDLAVLLRDEIWIVDFKTDRVTEGDVEERAREHAQQLQLYARALERIYGRPVTRGILFFLAPRRTVAVPLGRPAP